MIEVYSKEDCPFCTKAKALLSQEGYTFLEYDIVQEAGRRDELLKRNPDAKTVPQIFIDGELIGGYVELVKHFG